MKNYKKILENFFAGVLSEAEHEKLKKEFIIKLSKILKITSINKPLLSVDLNSYIEDLAQEVFLAIYNNAEKVYNQHKDADEETFDKIFTCWINTTINNIIRNFWNCKILLSKTMLEPVLIYSQSNNDNISSDIDSIELLELENMDSNLIIEALINNLTDEEKEIVNLLVAGKKQKEIAKILSKSEATISRAIKSIAEKFKEIMKGEK